MGAQEASKINQAVMHESGSTSASIPERQSMHDQHSTRSDSGMIQVSYDWYISKFARIESPEFRFSLALSRWPELNELLR